MKIERINVLINSNANKHRKYLYNEMSALAKEHQLQVNFCNDSITLSSIPKELTKVLEDLKINFSILGK